MTSTPDRQNILSLVAEAVAAGAKEASACTTLGYSHLTIKRWRKVAADGRPTAGRPLPANALTQEEKKQIIHVCNTPEHASLPAAQIVPRLADAGVYLGSESTFRKVLKEHNQAHYRGRAKQRRTVKLPTTHTATGPGQIWVWDITYLKTDVIGRFWYLWLITDVFSRKIIAREVWPEESAAHSAELLQRAAISERLAGNCTPVVLHGDNGPTVKASLLDAKLASLGILPSHSRPRVSNDNAFAESLFRTLKYCPQYPPGGFATLEAARQWVDQFVSWYNDSHRHSSIGYVTPSQKHAGADLALLAKRAAIYEVARAARPERWIRKHCRNWEPVAEVSLNPRKEDKLPKPTVPEVAA